MKNKIYYSNIIGTKVDYKIQSERGAAIIMAYLAILMFLYMTLLFLDIPYMERVGRSIQRCADAAALAGAIQLTQRSSAATALQGWLDAKRAVIAVLGQNPIAGVDQTLLTALNSTSGTADPLDLDVGNYYRYPIFGKTISPQQVTVSISRGVYHRPNPWANNVRIFYPLEVTDTTNRVENVPAINSTCKTSVNPLNNPPHNSVHPNEPTECIPTPLIVNIADSVTITITISGIPTLYAKLLGFNSFTTITRTAVSVPE